MEKIKTIFKILYEQNGIPCDRICIDEVLEENSWVFTEPKVLAYRKWDGIPIAIINGNLYKRQQIETEHLQLLRKNAVKCGSEDPITGTTPYWIKCIESNPIEKYLWNAFNKLKEENKISDGTYEVCGRNIQSNKEKLKSNIAIPHKIELITDLEDYSFESIKNYLKQRNIEGIVFYHPDGRMAKIRLKDFGLKRK